MRIAKGTTNQTIKTENSSGSSFKISIFVTPLLLTTRHQQEEKVLCHTHKKNNFDSFLIIPQNIV